jgi:hypothetical protein
VCRFPSKTPRSQASGHTTITGANQKRSNQPRSLLSRSSQAKLRSEHWVLHRNRGNAELCCIAPRITDVEDHIAMFRGWLFLTTQQRQARCMTIGNRDDTIAPIRDLSGIAVSAVTRHLTNLQTCSYRPDKDSSTPCWLPTATVRYIVDADHRRR